MNLSMSDKHVDLLLINPPYHRRSGSGVVFPLGLGYIASAVLNAGFGVKILDSASYFESLDLKTLSSFRTWLIEILSRSRPNLAIGVGPCTTTSVRSLHVISEVCKQTYPDLPVIYGGPLTSLPGSENLFLEELSATGIVLGDGENIICDILRYLTNNQCLDSINGLRTSVSGPVKTNVIRDLDSLRFPLRPEKGVGNYSLSVRRQICNGPFATIIASRGCPYHCTYCTSGLLRDGNYNRRSLRNIVDEMHQLINTFGIESLVFYDDAFFPSSEKLHDDVEAFADSLCALQKPITWQIEIRPNVLLSMDSRIAKLLFKTGCRQINIGIEKSEFAASLSLGKNVNPDRLRETCKKILAVTPQMRLTGTFIIGGRGESFSTVQQMEEYANSLGLLFAHFYPLEVYPGTDLYNELHSTKEELWWHSQIMTHDLPWGEILYEDNTQDGRLLLDWVNHAYRSFYGNPEWQTRASHVLGKRYPVVLPQIMEWQTNRFRLQRG